MHKPFRLALVGTLLLGAATADSALAQDLFVNAALGSDANDGLSEQTAFRTITRALEDGNSGPIRSVIIAPGVYDSALGETFPLRVGRRRDIAGMRGAVIDAGGEPVAIRTNGRAGQPALGVRGVEIRDADVGLEVTGGPVFGGGLAIHSCDIGILASNPAALATVSIVPIACRICDCRVGVEARGRFRVSLQACNIRDIGEDGVRMDYSGQAGTAALRVNKCNILDCGRDGIRFTGPSSTPVDVVVLGSVVGASQVGIHLPDSSAGMDVAVELRSATVASNGVGVVLPAQSTVSMSVDDTILARNGTDVMPGAAGVMVRDSLVEGGQYSGQPGVIAADPEFVDEAGRNYRLRMSSPAIDAALPSFYTVNPQTLSGRRCDGDQDGILEKDFGAHEFSTLRTRSQAVSGGSLTLELVGEAGATGFLYRADGLPQVFGFGIRTPSGLLELDRGTAVMEASFSLPAAFGGVTIQVPVTGDPAMIGRSLLYQGIVSSSASPTGWAFTNLARAFIVAP